MPPAKKRKINAAPPATGSPASDVSQQHQEVLKKMNDMCTRVDTQFEELKKEMKEGKKESYVDMFPAKKKKFTLNHTFKNVSSMVNNDCKRSDKQNYFGADWHIHIQRREDHLSVHLYCEMPQYSDQWSITTESKYIVAIPTGSKVRLETETKYDNKRISWGYAKLIKWESVLESAVNDEITIEIEVKITKMTGVAKPKPRSFDENQREFADVVLTVDGEDFYVLKKFLASTSSYFKSMFFSNFEEATKDQIDLPGIDARDFQNFLDTIHGEVELDDSSIEGVLHLAHMYDALSVLKACEKFLILESTMTDGKKFDLSKKYSMEKLAEKCISGMKVDEIDAALEDKEISSAISVKLAKQMVVLYKRDVKAPGST